MIPFDRRSFLLAMTLPLYAEAPLQSFTAGEAALVEALCDCIIPEDDMPGAKKAGVIYYLDRQLAGPLQRFLAAYQSGIPRFEAYCRRSTGKNFADLPETLRVEFLQKLEKSADLETISFFRMVVDQTMQGFYGSPAHGGNRDEASWRMLGITGLFEGHGH